MLYVMINTNLSKCAWYTRLATEKVCGKDDSMKNHKRVDYGWGAINGKTKIYYKHK